MPTRRQLIQKITLNANASSITFSNIPQNYTDLKIVASARSTQAAAATNMRMTLNGSSSGYNERVLYGDSVGASSYSNSSVTLFTIGLCSAASSTSNTFGSIEISIPNYTSSNNKSLSSKYVAENNSSAQNTAYIGQLAGLWANTSAINSISFTLASGNYAAGSTFYLYGITHVPIIRGGEVSVRDGFKYHTFRSTASLQVIEPGNVELAVQGGGGAGSGGISGVNYGAAGAGGNNYSGRARVPVGTLTVTVGSGGAGAFNVDGTSGTASSISSVVSASGGGFGQANGDYGGSNSIYSGGYNNGYFGGGGAGAGANGSGGDPGIGVLNFDGVRRGGGGGANKSHDGITLGVDGGGSGWGGSYTGTNRPSWNGEIYRGGGGAGTLGSYAPNGGSGIVIIRYPYDGN
jgi:hypothetical protein